MSELEVLSPNIEAEERTPQQEPGLLIEGLASLPAAAMLDESRLAAILGVTARTVRRMVDRGELPAPFKFGRRSTWLAGRIVQHVEKAAQRAEDQAEAEAARFDRQRP